MKATKPTDEQMKLARIEFARMGGSVKCPKGFSSPKVKRKAIRTRKKNAEKRRRERVEKAADATILRLTLITNDDAMSRAIVEAVRQKRVCNLHFKAGRKQ